MKVLKMTPLEEGGKPTIDVVEIEQGLEHLQKEVNGYIEMMELNIKGNFYDIVFNEEGKLEELPPCLGLLHKGELFDIVMGNVLFVRTDEEGATIGLEDSDIQAIKEYLSEGFQVSHPKGVFPAYSFD